MSKTVAVMDTERFAALMGNARDIVVVIDEFGTILSASASSLSVLGLLAGDQVGRNVIEFCHPDDVGGAAAVLSTAAVSVGANESIELRVLHADGHAIPVEVLPKNLLSSEGAIVLTIRDVSERLHAEQLRVETETRFRLVAESAPVGMFHLGPDGQCLFINRKWEDVSGQRPGDAIGFGWLDALTPASRSAAMSAWAGGEDQGEVELDLIRSDGDARTAIVRWCTLRDAGGRALGFSGTAEDITERKALEARLAHQATHDALTDLPNRVLLMQLLGDSLARPESSRSDVAVLFVDLDNFKVVNDSLGHSAGDLLLLQVSGRLQAAMRSSDVIGRLGGDEFMVIAQGIPDEGAAVDVGRRLNDALAEPFSIGSDQPYHCCASIGVAVAQADSTATSLVRDADAAMYRAKDRGRSRVELFESTMRSNAVRRLMLDAELRVAIASGELLLDYQPIVRAHTGVLVGIEALVRWRHPIRGLVAPSDFIPIAEQTGLIVPLGDWVLDRACRDFVDVHDLHVNVNLSGRQLGDPELVDRVRSILATTGFPARRLTLEITETALMNDVRSASAQLAQLKALGVSIAVDDFGTGYSSLSYLSQLPVDCLKVDRSFVDRLDVADGGAEIVRAVVTLAHALGLSATAEGVETQAQREALVALGCDLAQGYLFARPMRRDAILQLRADADGVRADLALLTR